MTRENIIKLEEKTKGLKEVLGGLKNRLGGLNNRLGDTPKPKILSPVDPKSLLPRGNNKQRKQTIANDTSFKGSKSGEQPIKKTPKGKVKRQTKPTPYKQRGHTVFRRGGRSGAPAKNPHTTRLRKDGAGYGNLFTANTLAYGTVEDETFVGLPANDPEKQETYIGHNVKEKVDMNKISKTRIGDDIHYYVNGVEDRGIVSKMSSTYVTVFKEDGKFYDIHINDTFFVKDILINKTWNNMSLEERTDVLLKVKAYSPRFLYKHWEDLPRELREVMKIKNGALPKHEGQSHGEQSTAAKLTGREPHEIDNKRSDSFTPDGKHDSDRFELLESHFVKPTVPHSQRPSDFAHRVSEADASIIGLNDGSKKAPKGKGSAKDIALKTEHNEGVYGNVAGMSNIGVSTKIPIDTEEDYKGHKIDDKEYFKYEDKKPTTKDTGMSTTGDTSNMNPTYGGKKDKKKVGEFIYTESSKYKVKGIPEQLGSYGVKYNVKAGEEKGITRDSEHETDEDRKDITQKKN